MYKVVYVILVFDMHSEELIAEVSLSKQEAANIRQMIIKYDKSFNTDEIIVERHFLSGSYPLRGNLLQKVFDLLGDRLEKGNYGYFFEAQRED